MRRQQAADRRKPAGRREGAGHEDPPARDLRVGRPLQTGTPPVATSVLTPLAAAPAGLVLRNMRTGRIVADRLLPALDSESRRRGLLKHTSLDAGEAMIIAPTNAVHTWFMKFAIDIAFVTRDGRVLKTRDS